MPPVGRTLPLMAAAPPRFPGGGRYRRLGPALRERFGCRVHKVTLRGGFGCPNRDGRVGQGGCIFCSSEALLPASGPPFGPLEEQLEAGLRAVSRRTGAVKAIAYFQDQTATDAPLERLESLFRAALAHPAVVALSVGTRPDWLPDQVIDLLAALSRQKPVTVELGLQSASDESLTRLRRGHRVLDFDDAVQRCHRAGLEVVAQVILDLPWEGEAEVRATAELLGRLEVEGVKVHNLHVLRNTPLAELWLRGEVALRSLEGYAELAAGFLELLPPSMIIHRLTGEGPARLMLAPPWGRQKTEIIRAIERQLEESRSWQGRLYHAA